MMKKILLVTGKSASEMLEKYARQSKTPHEIHVCKTDIAALISAELIIKKLSGRNLSEISTIIVPGQMKGDVSVITEKLSIPCFKGPSHVADVPLVLDMIPKIKLSPVKSANSVLEDEIKKRADNAIKKAYKSESFRMKIGGVPIGIGITQVLAEIADAPMLSDNEIRKKANHYKNSGAKIIDTGMMSHETGSDRIREIIALVKSAGLPVSIDTTNEKEILAGVDAGVDLIMSLDETNYEIAGSIDVPAVVIPRTEKGIPKNIDDRVNLVEKLISKIGNLNNNLENRLIADTILDPLNFNFTQSVVGYYEFRKRNPRVPVLMGVGNVVEMLDADSVGVNALLMGIASELDIDLAFTTEYSVKTKGSVRELVRASEMMYLAKTKKQTPKDLGINLLILKDKRKVRDILPEVDENFKFIKVRKTPIKQLEEGCFRIYLDKGKIHVIYYLDDIRVGFTGTDAKDLYKAIANHPDIKISTEHAAYLGKETGKAETALKLNKNYIQDTELF